MARCNCDRVRRSLALILVATKFGRSPCNNPGAERNTCAEVPGAADAKDPRCLRCVLLCERNGPVSSRKVLHHPLHPDVHQEIADDSAGSGGLTCLGGGVVPQAERATAARTSDKSGIVRCLTVASSLGVSRGEGRTFTPLSNRVRPRQVGPRHLRWAPSRKRRSGASWEASGAGPVTQHPQTAWDSPTCLRGVGGGPPFLALRGTDPNSLGQCASRGQPVLEQPVQ